MVRADEPGTHHGLHKSKCFIHIFRCRETGSKVLHQAIHDVDVTSVKFTRFASMVMTSALLSKRLFDIEV
jgi:hypothetical protein